MKLKIYQVDAFTDQVFKGNPAAVCPLEQWPDDSLLLKIAKENNLSETAFYVPKNNAFEIRWFTPEIEIDLCGHATLATAFVLHHHEGFKESTIRFHSPRSGNLLVTIQNDLFLLDFPIDQFKKTELTDELISLTDKSPVAAYKGKTDYMLIFEKEEDIANIKPNLGLISNLKARGIIVTAKGLKHDFVSRFFAPGVGVDEDPVCGSAHTTLTPYWATELNKKELSAYQLSERGGEIKCRLAGERVELGGNAVLYMAGEVFV